MELKNKKILFLGDSITEGTGASSPEKGYVSVFGQISGAKVKNYGIGGTRIAKQSKISLSEDNDRNFMSRVSEMESEADAVVVFGGTNDFGHGVSTIGDFSSRDECTFYGALNVNDAPEQKVSEYIKQVKNPYCFLCGGYVVKLEYSKEGRTIEDCFIKMIESLL